MDIFLAVFMNCGSMPIKPGGEPVRVCIASLLHTIRAPYETCKLGAAAEAQAAELRLIKGGFTNTISSYQCFVLGDEATKDESMSRYMREQYGAVQTSVMHLDYKDGEFVRRDGGPKQSKKQGQTL